MHLITLLTTAINPGPYDPPQAPASHIGALGGWGGQPAWTLVIIGVLVFAVGFLLIEFDAELVGGPLLGFGILLGVLGVLFGVNHSAQEHAEDRKAVSAYRAKTDAYDNAYYATFTKWLSADYGITVDHDSAQQLIGGGQLVATTRGGQQMIELAPTVDHLLAVRVVGGTILQPIAAGE